MPSLANLLENYRNWKGRQDWQSGKEMQDYFGGDPVAQEQFEQLSGFGTGSHGVQGGLAGMIKASHGSPHAFEKFDFSKIGSGEGAQAYGHGGYFAQGFDSPVAKEYQRQLAGKDEGIAGQIASNAIKGRTPEQAIDYLTPTNSMTKEAAQVQQQAIDLIKQGLASKGHLYNVELKWPDAAKEAADPLGEHHLFEWHTPLNELSAKDAEIINPILKKLNESPNPSLFSNVQTAGDVVKYAQALGLNPANEIAKAGYPGIKYLDAGSRGVGKGSRNYVMFDDRFPEIVSRNGVSLSDLLRR